MAKKKNRKKAMKRQQKISIKVDPSGLFGEWWPKTNLCGTLWPFELDQQDLALRQLYAQYSEQELNQEFFNQQMELVRTGRFPFSEENLLLMAIINEDDDALRLKKIRSLIAENPSSYDAQLLLEMEHLDVLSPAFYTDFQDFVEWTLKLWRQEGYLDYNYLHSRSHWAGLVFALKVYLKLGYNTAALNLVEKIIAHRAERYASGFLPLAFAAYLVNGRLDKIDQLYRQVSQKPISMAGPLVYKIFSSLLSGKRERAKKEFNHLLQINDEASSFFSGPWQDTVFDYSELEAFVPNS